MKIARPRLSGEMICSGVHIYTVIFTLCLGTPSNTVNLISFSWVVLAAVIVEVFVAFAAFAAFAVHL